MKKHSQIKDQQSNKNTATMNLLDYILIRPKDTQSKLLEEEIKKQVRQLFELIDCVNTGEDSWKS